VPPPYDADAHATLVPDVHDALLHATASTIDGVGSFALKLSPESVTDPPPDCAMLDGLVPVATGAAHTPQFGACGTRIRFGRAHRQS
jgi:hypothetical protein